MEDYEVNGIEDPITYFALFADCDPMTFERNSPPRSVRRVLMSFPASFSALALKL
jgi:hypothetical protein